MSFSLDPTLWCPIGQFWTWVMAAVKSKTYTQNRQPSDKTQSSRFCQLDVKWIPVRFQNQKKKRKWFFDHSTTLKASWIQWNTVIKTRCPVLQITFLKDCLVAILSCGMLRDARNLGTVALETKVAFTNLALPPNPHHYCMLALTTMSMASIIRFPYWKWQS